MSPDRRGWDAIVVGGGPAGSATGTLLARQGKRVLVLDRATFPRRKACGESVNPGAVGELQALGLLPLIEALPHQKIVRWRLHPSIGPTFTGALPSDRPGLAIDRAAFDHALLGAASAAGAEVRTGSHVVDLVFDRGTVAGVRCSDGTAHRARVVIGADGLRSVVLRRLKLLGRRPRLRKIALTAHVSGAHLPEATGEMHLKDWGCIGIVAVEEKVANVVVVLNQDETHLLAGGTENSFDRLIAEEPSLAAARRVSGVLSTGPFDCPTVGVVADGALLVGDAAGYFDPFTGQGIYRALRGARLAAAVLERALESGDCGRSSLIPYARAHLSQFGRGERLQRGIEAFVSRPRAMSVAAAGLASWPAAADRLVALTGDVRDPLQDRDKRAGLL